MDVFDVVKIANAEGKILSVQVSDLECKMLLTYAINELINRGSLSLLSPEDREKLRGLESLLEQEVKGNA